MAVPTFPRLADFPTPPTRPEQSNPSDTAATVLEWPKLDGMEDVDISDEPPADWMHSCCPAELLDFSSATPPELVRILKLSVKADFYKTPECEKEIVVPGIPYEKISSPVESRFRHLKNLSKSDSGSFITRSSTNLSERSSTYSKDSSRIRAYSSSIRGKYSVQECASCLEGITEKNLILLQCQHRYCLKCFVKLVTTAIHTESQFPPKCCLMDIPIKKILHNLDNTNRELYKEKLVEYSIPQQERWYCASTACGKWIHPNKIKAASPVQKCGACKTKMCGYCRRVMDKNRHDCPRDASLEATLEEAEMYGWRRCYQCHTMVELVSGCRHMTCKCGAQFCYTCAAPWRTCQCTEADQRHREEALQARRLQRNEAADQEAQELAIALAEIELLEQRELEEQVRQAEREAEERARLEETRKRREEDLVRERENQRLMVVAESIRGLRLVLDQINESQQTILIARHEGTSNSLRHKIEEETKQFDDRRDRLRNALQSAWKKRSEALASAQEAEFKAMTEKHEEEEDETFISMSRHLKNRPNREERERSIMEKLKASQDREITSLQKTHSEALEVIDSKARLETHSLEAGLAGEASKSCPSIAQRFDLAHQISIERHWFRVVTKKRYKLLELHRLRLIQPPKQPEDRPKIFAKHSSKPPTPPPRYPLPPTPNEAPKPPAKAPKVTLSVTPPLTMFPPHPRANTFISRVLEAPRPASPMKANQMKANQMKAPLAAIVEPPPIVKKETVSLKELIMANSRNRRLNRSAFSVLN